MDSNKWLAERKARTAIHEQQIEDDLRELEEYKNNLLWKIRAKRLLTPEAYKKYCARNGVAI